MNYEPLIERDLAAIPRAVLEFRDAHGSEETWKAVARFAVLAYAPAQHAKHALLCCLAAWEIREALGERFDDALVECAIYAATSRQPWSEPPILDPPSVEQDQRGDCDELREAVHAADRLRAERWLAKRFTDDDLAADYFAVAADDFEDLGHKLIVANAAWKLASLLGDKGRYAALRVGVWEMVAYRGERYRERGGAVTADMLADNMVASHGDLESAHAVFLFDAARETGQEKRVSDYLATLTRPPATLSRSAGEGRGEGVPIYRYARDCGEYLKSHAAAKRLGIDRIIAAAWENLEQGSSLEAFSFA
ncbi:MAG: hypothetical protein AABO58_12245 [Acidobacteriota bacterium]